MNSLIPTIGEMMQYHKEQDSDYGHIKCTGCYCRFPEELITESGECKECANYKD